jgi:hypothetical protein
MAACLSAATFGSTGVDVRPLQGVLAEQSSSKTAVFMHLQNKIVMLNSFIFYTVTFLNSSDIKSLHKYKTFSGHLMMMFQLQKLYSMK